MFLTVFILPKNTFDFIILRIGIAKTIQIQISQKYTSLCDIHYLTF